MNVLNFRGNWWHYVSVFAVLLFFTAPVSGQFVQVGTPSGVSNTNSSYPSPFGNWYYGARQQYLYPAGELAAAGIAAGDITAMRFNVTTSSGAVHNAYTIKIGQTTANSLTSWQTGLTTVYGPVTVTPVVGNNTMNFTAPFTWDGTSNIVVEICFQNSGYTSNSHVEWTTVLPYNGSRTYRADSQGICSNTSVSSSQNETRRPITSFEATLAACPPPDVAVTSVTSTSADLDITLSTGDFYIEYGAPGFTPGTDANAGGGTVSGPFTTSPQTISGLSPSTVYDVYVRQDCGTEWSLNGMTSFSTACGIPTAPFTESFESYTPTTNATWDQCITAAPSNTTSLFRWDRSSSTTSSINTGPTGAAHGSTYAYTEASSGSSGAITTLDLTPVDVSSLTSPILEFNYHMYGVDINTLNIKASNDGVTFNTVASLVGQQHANTSAPWSESAVDLSAYPGIVHIRFEAIRGSSFDGDIAIDNIRYKEAPTCGKPSFVTLDSKTATTADISWTCMACVGDFYIEYGPVGFTPGVDGTAGGGTVSGPFAGSPANVTGLSANTAYDVYVRQDCGGNGFGENNTSPLMIYTGACIDGGPTYIFDTNVGTVSASGIGTSFTYDHCVSPGGADQGYLGVNIQTALSVNVAEGLPASIVVGWNACDGSNYTASGSVWVDWNSNLTFEPSELIGSASNGATGTYSLTPPPGTSLGAKTVRVMLQEGGSQPLDPCASFGYGSVTDFSVNVIAPPACSVPTATFAMDANCPNSEFSITVNLTDVGSSTGGVVNINNNGGAPAITGVGTGVYTVGPFTAGSSASVTIENLDDPICNLTSSIFTTDCQLCAGGPTSIFDTNVGVVSANGIASTFSYDHCVSPGGSDQGYLGVNNQTALSVSVAEGIPASVVVGWNACDGSNYTAVGSVWVDWNGDTNLDPGEVIGTTTSNGVTGTYSLTPPPGTPLGSKIMRVMVQEGGSLPLDPCASFSYGSVTDFTVVVIAPPACTVPTATFALAANCPNNEFSIQVDLTDVGSSTGGVVNINNNGGAPAITGVGTGIYTVGPFIAGSTVSVTIENLDDPLCNLVSSVFSTECQYCTSGGPSSTSWTNVEQVDIIGFAGSSISHTGCNPAVTGVEDLTALSVDIPNGFSYNLEVDFGTCTTIYGAAGAAWVDWNGDTNFDPSELVGSTSANPFSASWAVTPPPGTQLGPKVMRIMQVEGGSLPLDPCASFTWGSVMDFTVNVIAPPTCTVPMATFALDADCPNNQFSITVDLTDVGSSTGGLVDITNNGGAAAQTGVGVGTYTVGPFTAGASVLVTIENLDDPLCNLVSSVFSTECQYCTSGGPTSTGWSNVEQVTINGFNGSSISHTGCPGVTGTQNLTTQSVDIPNNFNYNLLVKFGSCETYYSGAGAVWVDWNGDTNFTLDELVGSTLVPNSALTVNWSVTPPPGTTPGPKVMRVMQQESTSLPLDPCASYTWGSMMDFTVNVVADPGCTPPTATTSIAPDCLNDQYFIDVDVTSLGSDGSFDLITDVNGLEVTITATGIEQIGPFPSESDVNITLDHTTPICVTSLPTISYICPPINDNCEDVTPTTLLSGVTSTFTGTTYGANESPPFTGAPAVWVAFEVTGSCNNVTIDFCGNSPQFFGAFTALAPTCPSDANSLVSNTLVDWTICGDDNPTMFFAELPAGIYYLPIAGETAENIPGPYSIDILSEDCTTLPSDDCAGGYTSNPSATIPDNGTITDVITVAAPSGGAVILDLDVAVDVNHTYMGDVRLELTSPCGTTVTLFDGSCGSDDDMQALFDDEASLDISSWCVFRFGDVMPVGSLSDFDNEVITGDWTLTASDIAGGFSGTLIKWCLIPTLGDVCLPPIAEVTGWDDTTISLDVSASGCFDIGSYTSYDVSYDDGTNTFTDAGVSMPHTITGLTPGTPYTLTIVGNCAGGPSAGFIVNQATNLCASADLCSYELILSNSSGTGFGGASIAVNNGWTNLSYSLHPDSASETFTVLACAGTSLSLTMNNGGNGDLSSNYGVSLVNSTAVEVFGVNGPSESIIYTQNDGCPDCAPVTSVLLTRTAADLVELSWTNIQPVGDVDDIFIDIYMDDIFGSIPITNLTVPAGTNSASVNLGGSYAFSEITIDIITNCTGGGNPAAQVVTTLPGCDAVDQCEYVFDMNSASGGWGGYGLEASINGGAPISVNLTGSSGSQTVYACDNGTIEVTAVTGTSSGTPVGCNNSLGSYGSGTLTNSGSLVTFTTCNYAEEHVPFTINNPGIYQFTASEGAFITLTDGAGNILADGAYSVMQATVLTPGAHRLYVTANDDCVTDWGYCITTTGQYISPAGCAANDFSLTLNPSTDNVPLVTNTNFCDFGDGEVVYSGFTCPDCYAAVDVVIDSYTDVAVDVSWNSFNPAGTAYTVHVGLPGFTPGDANEVATASGVTAASGAQGPETVIGLSGNTDYEAIVVENCGGSPADASPAAAFTTDVTGDVCTTAIPLTMQAGGGCPAGATTASFADMTSTGNSVSCIDFEVSANRDMWFSFNSGSNEYVSLYIEIDASEFLVVEVFQGCGGPVVFCENGYGSPQFIDVNPNEDYYVRVMSSAANMQDAHVCVSPPSGCTDPNSLNYDDRASVDDGSCYDCSTAISVPVNAAGACPASQQMFDNTNSDNTLGNFVSCVGATIPSRDEFYTFNSGTVQAVEISLDLGTAGYLAIEVFQECNGQSLYCESGVQGATTISLGVQQNTDYTIRIVGYDNLGLGTYFLCVMEDANPSPGCTDPNAPNYDPTAGIDDGSCIDCGPDTGVSIVMEDSFGDGWNGGSYTITSFADPLNPVVVATGSINTADEGNNSFGRDFHCLADGCYEITVDGGSYPSEVTWGITGIDYGSILNQNAPATASFTINTASCPVVGCTDSNAINWNPLANVDDGSCEVPISSCGPDDYSVCYDYSADDYYYYSAASGSDLYLAITGGYLEDGWGYAYIYDGHSTSANLLATITGNAPVGQVLHSTTGDLMIHITGDEFSSCLGSGYDPFTYQVRCDAPATSTCATAQSISAATYPAYSTTVGNLWYIANDNAAVCSGNQGPSKYYTFTVTEENHYVAKVNPYQGADVVLEVLDGCGGTVLECIDNAGPGGEEVAAMQDLAPGTYVLRVHNVSGGAQVPGTSGFLVRLQQLPIAGVQDNPSNFLYACNQGGFFLEDFVGATPQTPELPGVLDWKWLSADVGGTFSHTFVRGSTNYAARISWLGMVPATTYNVFVSVQLNHPEFGPIWTNYGGDYNNPNNNGASACTVSTAATVTPTELLPAYASPVGGPFSLCDIVIAHNVSDAENFQWRFDPDVNTPGDELIYTRGSGNPSVRLSWVNNIQPGVIYSVAVRAMVNGQWGTFGVERMLELQAVPQNVSIRPQYCGGTYGPNSVILSESVCEADYYRFRFTPVLGGPAAYRTSGNYAVLLNGNLANLAPGDYYLDVKISQNGQPGDFGPDCIITIAGPQTPGQEGPAAQRATTAEGDATLFPNPNAGDEVRVELNGLDAGNHDVSITVYDIYGKMLTSEDFGSEGQFLSKLIRFDQNLSMGVYMIHVRVDGALFSVERLVVK